MIRSDNSPHRDFTAPLLTISCRPFVSTSRIEFQAARQLGFHWLKQRLSHRVLSPIPETVIPLKKYPSASIATPPASPTDPKRFCPISLLGTCHTNLLLSRQIQSEFTASAVPEKNLTKNNTPICNRFSGGEDGRARPRKGVQLRGCFPISRRGRGSANLVPAPPSIEQHGALWEMAFILANWGSLQYKFSCLGRFVGWLFVLRLGATHRRGNRPLLALPRTVDSWQGLSKRVVEFRPHSA